MSQGQAVGTAEHRRLREDDAREQNWKRWGPYLSERQWGTVREDYSADGETWQYFPHDHARSRAYRWGEDGLLGICDRECRLCFAPALWNGSDPILKERLFGLSGPEGNHGEDVKECYYYLDATPTHSYLRALYKYPQREFPYQELIDVNATRGLELREYELLDTGIFNDNRYFDVLVEYAKGGPNDILIRLTATNRGPAPAELHVLPTFWFRNTWSWSCTHEGCWPKPGIAQRGELLRTYHATLEPFWCAAGNLPDGGRPNWLFTENETHLERFGGVSRSPYTKDAFHRYLIAGETDAVHPGGRGTKVAAHYPLRLEPGASCELRLRMRMDLQAGQRQAPSSPLDLDREFQQVFADRMAEADAHFETVIPPGLDPDQRQIVRQSNAGLLWTKQFYHYVVRDWLAGDADPPAPQSRWQGRNRDWLHLFNRDVISMPDKWEYPWYAAWDLAFHMLPFARLDPGFAKHQLLLFLREWYQHPNGQLPAYEWALGDVNPPVHAWACWRVYQLSGPPGDRDRVFLARTFQKLLLNFTWWVNRKDVRGKHVFSGGFLGLDNIGIFDRSKPLPTGGHLEQADGTAWMAFYCSSMLSMAFELASENPAYEDMASKFFEHYIAIAEAMNTLDGTGLWDEVDGFYYDHLHVDGQAIPLRIRSLVGLIPLFTVDVLYNDVIDRLPGFRKRMEWFLRNRQLSEHMTYMEVGAEDGQHQGLRLLAIPSQQRLLRLLTHLLDENEFLSPYGIRSLSKVHQEQPFVLDMGGGGEHCVRYVPGESDSVMFGGNSNWRGPVWLPMNFLLVEALERYHQFYGDGLQVECPTGSGQRMHLGQVAKEIERRLIRLFQPDAQGLRPVHGDDPRYADDPHWRDLLLFYEYFHGDNGRGLGASHQTGWTALVSELIHKYRRD